MITLQADISSDLVEIIGRIRQYQMDFPLSVMFPTAASATKLAAAAIQEQWKAYAGGEPLPSGDKIKRPTGGYAASIGLQSESLWSHTISSSASVARWLEYGTPEVDFKETHPYGQRGRVAKKKIKGVKGAYRYVPYLIVPFRWATPGAGAHMGPKNVIPEQIYKMILSGYRKKTFARSIVLDEKTASPNFWGDMEQRNTYQWGSRVQGVGGNIEGLVSMQGMTKKNGKRESSYFTFRIISADSPASAWIKPATKALRIAEQTAAYMAPKVSKMVEDAFMADMGGMA